MSLGGGGSSPVNIGNAGETITLTNHAGALAFATSGAVTEGAGAVLTVGTVSGTTGALTLTGANQITTLGATQAAGIFALTDAAPLTVSGAVGSPASITIRDTGALQVGAGVTAPTITLAATGSGGTLTQTAGTIAATGTLELDSSGAVSQSGGAISAGSLAGAAASYALQQGGNAIGALGNLTSDGALGIADGQTLTVNGPVNAGGTTLAVTTGNLVVNGSLTVSSLDLTIAGTAVANASGTLTDTGALTGRAGVLQFGDPVSVSTLGPFTTTGAFDLADTSSLTITGPWPRARRPPCRRRVRCR